MVVVFKSGLAASARTGPSGWRGRFREPRRRPRVHVSVALFPIQAQGPVGKGQVTTTGDSWNRQLEPGSRHDGIMLP